MLTGSLGLVCLASVAVQRPLLLVAEQLTRRHKPIAPPARVDPAHRRFASRVTAIIGATFTVHGSALVVLALTTSSSTFVALHQAVGLPILGVGLAWLTWYRRRSHHPGDSDVP